MERILELAYELKKLITEDERLTSLNEAEEKMNNSEEVIKLTYKKDILADKYSDLLKYFSPESDEVSSVQKELFLAKKELEEHELVRDYLSKYQKVRMMYDFLNKEIFSLLDLHLCEVK